MLKVLFNRTQLHYSASILHPFWFTLYFYLLADSSIQFAGKSMHFIDLIMTYSAVFHYFV